MIAIVKKGHWSTGHTKDFQLESLRKGETVLASYSPEYDCPVLLARAKSGKERLLGLWTDALITGTATVKDLVKTGICVEMRSVGGLFS